MARAAGWLGRNNCFSFSPWKPVGSLQAAHVSPRAAVKDPAVLEKGPQLLGDKRARPGDVRPHMLAMGWHAGRLLRHGLAPLLGSGLAVLVPFWHLPAQILALALPGPLSSLRNMICPSAPAPSLLGAWLLPPAPSLLVQPCCYLTQAPLPLHSHFPGHLSQPHLLSASGDLESVLNSGVGARARHKPCSIPENASFETR